GCVKSEHFCETLISFYDTPLKSENMNHKLRRDFLSSKYRDSVKASIFARPS
ncbi:1970_t:CDS:1, partial [Scutellospora calospora]